ncbi:hypothetical protein FB446DRAFT_787875 [Lentinula raphanica]|nr:hypothetical protein FB446DRAFT_787875 [Lentinula raphanica]
MPPKLARILFYWAAPFFFMQLLLIGTLSSSTVMALRVTSSPTLGVGHDHAQTDSSSFMPQSESFVVSNSCTIILFPGARGIVVDRKTIRWYTINPELPFSVRKLEVYHEGHVSGEVKDFGFRTSASLGKFYKELKAIDETVLNSVDPVGTVIEEMKEMGFVYANNWIKAVDDLENWTEETQIKALEVLESLPSEPFRVEFVYRSHLKDHSWGIVIDRKEAIWYKMDPRPPTRFYPISSVKYESVEVEVLKDFGFRTTESVYSCMHSLIVFHRRPRRRNEFMLEAGVREMGSHGYFLAEESWDKAVGELKEWHEMTMKVAEEKLGWF